MGSLRGQRRVFVKTAKSQRPRDGGSTPCWTNRRLAPECPSRPPHPRSSGRLALLSCRVLLGLLLLASQGAFAESSRSWLKANSLISRKKKGSGWERKWVLERCVWRRARACLWRSRTRALQGGSEIDGSGKLAQPGRRQAHEGGGQRAVLLERMDDGQTAARVLQ